MLKNNPDSVYAIAKVISMLSHVDFHAEHPQQAKHAFPPTIPVRNDCCSTFPHALQGLAAVFGLTHSIPPDLACN